MEPLSFEIPTTTRSYRLIHEIYVLLDAGDRQVLSAFDLTTSQYRVLSLLVANAAYRMTDLSDILLCARSTITRLIDSLEQAHLVQRNADGVDRRAQQVVLTPMGRERWQQAQQAHEQSLMQRMAALSSDEQADLVQRLEQMRDSLRIVLPI
jgi:DNA-binding MarR family transcriptional regulator